MVSHPSLHVHGSPAAARSARARDVLIVPVKVVVDRQLLALGNPAPAEVEDVSPQNAGGQVRITRVIDELGARPADAAVEGPVTVQLEEVFGILAPLLLVAVDPLPRVFEHLASGRDRLACVHAPPMNSRAADAQAKAGIPGVDGWSVIGGRLCHDAPHFLSGQGRGLAGRKNGFSPAREPTTASPRYLALRAPRGRNPALPRLLPFCSCARSLYLTPRLRQEANGFLGSLPRPEVEG